MLFFDSRRLFAGVATGPWIGLIAVLLATTAVYQLSLPGFFVFDDDPNIVRNSHIQISSLSLAALKQAVLTGESSVLGRPVSMLSFALNYYAAGLDAYWFRVTGVAIHLVNGVLLFALATLLLRVVTESQGRPVSLSPSWQWFPLLLTAFWLLNPINFTAAVYIVQRMTSLSAMFVFLSLLSYVYYRWRCVDQQRPWAVWLVLALWVFPLMSVAAKENGALVYLFLLLVEITFFRFRAASVGLKIQSVALLTLVSVAAFAVLINLKSAVAWLQAGYTMRDFTLGERVLTELRVLVLYARQIFIPDITMMGIYFDSLSVSRSWFEPGSTIAAALLHGLIVATAALARSRYVWFGVAWFYGGHLVESSVISLELAFEHRNYVPSIGLLLIAVGAGLRLFERSAGRGVRRVLLVGAFAWLALATMIVASRAITWSDERRFHIEHAKRQPDSQRANWEAMRYFSNPLLSGSASLDAVQKQRLLSLALEYLVGAEQAGRDAAELALVRVSLVWAASQEFDAESFAKMLWGFKNARPSRSRVRSVLAAVRALRREGDVQWLRPEQADRMFAALLANEYMGEGQRALAYTAEMEFCLHPEVRALERAYFAAARATAISPNEPHHWLNFARVALLVRERAAVEMALNEIESLDRFGALAGQVGVLREKLAEAVW